VQVEELPSAASAQAFYEARYAHGYMDRWEQARSARLCSVLDGVQLPPRPRILDYGCGSGALTALLAERWPDAEVVGADISATAVASARQRREGIRFHTLDARFVREHAGAFDLVFSHHVLEHVFDLDAATGELAALVAPGGRMLHALPCGNAGSLAHWLCRQREGGIDPAVGNRFYFEESSHLRRLCSDELAARFGARGCRLVHASFGYHWLGAVRLFTEWTPRELLALFDLRRFRAASLPLVLALGIGCAMLAAARAPVQVLMRTRRMLQQVLSFRTRRFTAPSSLALLALAVPALLLLPLSLLAEGAIRAADAREWRRRREDPRGSEMMLEFVRDAAPAETDTQSAAWHVEA
jgi:SAM-dependent methyltransferase